MVECVGRERATPPDDTRARQGLTCALTQYALICLVLTSILIPTHRWSTEDLGLFFFSFNQWTDSPTSLGLLCVNIESEGGRGWRAMDGRKGNWSPMSILYEENISVGSPPLRA